MQQKSQPIRLALQNASMIQNNSARLPLSPFFSRRSRYLSDKLGMHYFVGVVLLASLLLSGCDSGGPEMIHVSGTVTVDGEPAPGPGTIIFAILKSPDGVSARSGRAQFDSSGYYEATLFKLGDGLFPGTYKVGIQCWKSPPNMEGRPVISFIDRKYNSATRSPLDTLVLEKGADDVELNFDIPSGK